MNLVESTINVDSGLDWEQNLNSSLTIIDGHNHAPGFGVQITPAGLNINGALPLQNNPVTEAQGIVFTPQTSLSTLSAVYSIGADLYYNDANGNVIQITSGGNVNATSSGISSGTATASFVTNVLVVNAASNTPANIQGGSILLGNNSSGSKFLTLSPPNAMAANYSITLPSIPASQSFVTLDTSGNLAGTYAIAAGLLRSNLPPVGQIISASCGNFATASTSLTPVTNLSVTITSTGRPISVFVGSDGTDSGYTSGLGNAFYAVTGFGQVVLLRGASIIAGQVITGGTQIAASGINILDPRSAGTYTYSVQVNSPSGHTVGAAYLSLYAHEL